MKKQGIKKVKRYKFSQAELRIKDELLSKLIDNCISCNEMTRSELASLSGVSEMTAGKLLSALDECRFTDLIYKRSPDGGSPTKLHVFSDSLSALIIDLSSKAFSYSLINGNGECKLYEGYRFDTTANVRENLNAFLSRTVAALTKEKAVIASICVIVPDNSRHLTELQNRDTVCDLIAAFFGICPTLCLTQAEALSYALKYKVKNDFSGGTKTAYIYIGEIQTAVFFPASGDPISCFLGDLMLSNSTTLSEMLDAANGERDVAKVIARAVNFVSCAFSPDNIIIEYDGIKVGAQALAQTKSAFAITLTEMPEISISKRAPGLSHYGAAKATSAAFIKKHIKGI